jgi:hypothetical protein
LSLSGVSLLFETSRGDLKPILNLRPFSVNSVHSHVKPPLSSFSSSSPSPSSSYNFLSLAAPLLSYPFYLFVLPSEAGSGSPELLTNFKMSSSLPGSLPFPNTAHGCENPSPNSPVDDTFSTMTVNLGFGFAFTSNELFLVFFFFS